MILMVNCSYKGAAANTRYFLQILEKEIKELSQEASVMFDIKQILTGGYEEFEKELLKADALVIGAPLYVDGLPAQAVRLLEQLYETCHDRFPQVPVYVVSNLGFYEPEQIRNLFDIVTNWCVKMDTVYGGGLAIGAGPMIRILQNMPLKTGLNKMIGTGFSRLAKAIAKKKPIENQYCKTAIPRWVYLMAAHANFRKEIRTNTK